MYLQNGDACCFQIVFTAQKDFWSTSFYQFAQSFKHVIHSTYFQQHPVFPLFLEKCLNLFNSNKFPSETSMLHPDWLDGHHVLELRADSEPRRTLYNLRQDRGVFDRNLTTEPGRLQS